MSDVVFDLFGNPSRPGRGQRGRPAYEATEKDRNKVKMLLALGWGNQRIANALAISLATLKRYFRSELKVRDEMRDRFDAERIMSVADAALKGNVGAARELQRLIDRNDRMEVERKLAEKPEQKRPETVGKKQLDGQRALDAEASLMAQLEEEARDQRKQ